MPGTAFAKCSRLNWLEAVARDISDAGVAETAQVDALNKQAVESYLGEVVRTAGSIDISFNVIGLEDDQGVLLVEMAQEPFMLPVMNAVASHFLTATAAVRYMARKMKDVLKSVRLLRYH
jgi:NAD(P)-dependent dehydrogenase (short-subunit alcohol dehydrogenase family)